MLFFFPSAFQYLEQFGRGPPFPYQANRCTPFLMLERMAKQNEIYLLAPQFR
jgi:hypothetical protein